MGRQCKLHTVTSWAAQPSCQAGEGAGMLHTAVNLYMAALQHVLAFCALGCR